MKGFFSIFSDSAKELKKIRTLTTTGMFMALAIVLRVFSIPITPDIRIAFSFLAIAIIAMLFGPIVAGMASISVDFIGFLLDQKTARGYYPPLAVVTLIAGMIYGIFLYQKEIKLHLIIISRIIVVVFCNVMLNSYFLYTGFVNKNFSFTSSQELTKFKVWITPRIVKNAILLPVEIVILCIILPVVFNVYKKAFKKSY